VGGGVVTGSGTSNGTLIEVNNPSSNTWTSAGNLSVARSQGTITLVGAPTISTVTLSSSPNPSKVNAPVNLSATISGTGVSATGNVTFLDGTTQIGTAALVNGTAQFQTSSLSVGLHHLTAMFNGGVGLTSGTSNVVSQQVQATPIFSGITSHTIVAGTQSVSLGGTLSAPGPIYPSGDHPVQVSIGGNALPLTVGAQGVFSINNYGTGGFAVGTYPITYSYPGDDSLAAVSDSSTTLTVTPAASLTPTVTLGSSANPSQAAAPVTFKATVSGTGATPTGMIVFNDGATAIGTGTLINGVATLAISSLTPGTHTITAGYSGDSNYQAGISAAVQQQVVAGGGGGPVTPTVTLAVDPTTAASGATITFTVTVSSSNGPVPTGSVTVSDSTNGNNRYGSSSLVNGIGVVTNSQIPPGTYTVTATYGGDGGVSYLGAQSNAVTFTINPTE
jgi:Bacterial Ig-like domain (group 3)